MNKSRVTILLAVGVLVGLIIGIPTGVLGYREVKARALEQGDVILFLDRQPLDKDIAMLEEKIGAWPEVASVRYVGADERMDRIVEALPTFAGLNGAHMGELFTPSFELTLRSPLPTSEAHRRARLLYPGVQETIGRD